MEASAYPFINVYVQTGLKVMVVKMKVGRPVYKNHQVTFYLLKLLMTTLTLTNLLILEIMMIIIITVEIILQVTTPMIIMLLAKSDLVNLKLT